MPWYKQIAVAYVKCRGISEMPWYKREVPNLQVARNRPLKVIKTTSIPQQTSK